VPPANAKTYVCPGCKLEARKASERVERRMKRAS
jgi:hypothetical protein